jgi:hypothetical protein
MLSERERFYDKKKKAEEKVGEEEAGVYMEGRAEHSRYKEWYREDGRRGKETWRP